MSDLLDLFRDLMQRGGWVMWPLLAMSLLAITLMFERAWFWLANNRPGAAGLIRQLADRLRRGEVASARSLVSDDHSIYGRAVRRIAEATDGSKQTDGIDDSLAAEIVEAQRPRLERFMPTLSTIITAAPLLGILGTVTGIIASFDLLSQGPAATDPRSVSAGIAEALLTTAAGLVVALIVLFPYNAYRAQIDRALGRLETLAGAAVRVPRPAGDEADNQAKSSDESSS